MSTPLSDILAQVKPALSPHLYDRLHHDLTLKENSLTSQRAQLIHQLHNSHSDILILDKNYRQLLSDYGDSQIECQTLRLNLDDVSLEATYLREENARLRESDVVLGRLDEEVIQLRDKCEEFKRVELELRETCEGLERRERGRVEEEKREKDELVRKNKLLQRNYDAVMAAAGNRFHRLEKLMSELEKEVAVLKANGARRISSTCGKEHPENWKFDEYQKGLGTPSVSKTNSLKENSASCNPAISATHLTERTTSSMPYTQKSQPASVSVVNLSDSEDEDMQFSTEIKRELPVSNVANEKAKEDGMTISNQNLKKRKDFGPESISKLPASDASAGDRADTFTSERYRSSMATLRPCEMKVERF